MDTIPPPQTHIWTHKKHKHVRDLVLKMTRAVDIPIHIYMIHISIQINPQDVVAYTYPAEVSHPPVVYIHLFDRLPPTPQLSSAEG